MDVQPDCAQRREKIRKMPTPIEAADSAPEWDVPAAPKDLQNQAGDQKPAGPAGGHEPALDGIRLFAFVAVFWFHACGVVGANNLIFITLPLGEGGVRAFFVLSGFLIGGILLNARDSHAVPVLEKLRTFYARRSLRIFPVYYFVLAISSLLGLAGLHQLHYSWTDPWDWFYLINVAIHFGRDWPGAQAHLWTLAVEEQFYLVAPLVILALSNRKISWICVFVWIGTTILRFRTSSDQFYGPLPWMQCDSLTLGIAAAILQRDGRFLGISPRAFGIAGIVFGVLAIPTNYFPWFMMAGPWTFLFGNKLAVAAMGACMGLGQWLLSAAVAAVILAFWNGRGGLARRIFGARPVAYLGKISYGLYLFHFFVLDIFVYYVPALSHRHWLAATIAFLVTFAISALSWHFIEYPINDLKRFFPYQKPESHGRRSDDNDRVMDTTAKNARRAMATAVLIIAATCAIVPVLRAHALRTQAHIAFVDDAVNLEPAVRGEFDRAYRRIATEDSHGRAPTDVWAPRYTERQVDGTTSGKMELEASVEGYRDNLNSFHFGNFQDTITLQSVAVDGDRTVAGYQIHVLVRDGRPRVVDDQTCQDFWIGHDGIWQIAMTKVIEDKVTVGNKVVQDQHAH
jgi:peptidoglycan/LPS O-acetylase OafA/YrhL